MPRVFNVGDAFSAFPNNAIGAEGDVAVREFTGECKRKISGAWVALLESTNMIQFVEGTANVPVANPPNTAMTAVYLGNVAGTLYWWSVATQAWVGIVTV